MKIVVLGDSYSSGTGAGDYVPAPKNCYRSQSNWAWKYAKALNLNGYHVVPTNRACHGAITSDIFSKQKRDVFPSLLFTCPAIGTENNGRLGESYDPMWTAEPLSPYPVDVKCQRTLAPQADAVDKDTDLVLLTTGGNDLKFREVVVSCFSVFKISGRGEACINLVKSAKDAAAMNSTVEKCTLPNGTGSNLVGCLRHAFEAVKRNGRPDMKVVLVSYPYLERNDDLAWDDYQLGHEMRVVGEQLDTLQFEALKSVYPNAVKASQCVRGGASCLAGSDAMLLDSVKQKFAGHEPDGRCFNDATVDPRSWLKEVWDPNPELWLNDVYLCFGGPWFPWFLLESYHPNPKGHEAIKDLLFPFEAFGAGGSGPKAGSSIDVVFAIDTTGSMGDDIAAVKRTASAFVDRLSSVSKSFRVGIVSYRDFPDRTGSAGDYASRVVLDFEDDKGSILAAIGALELGDGGDLPETVFSGIQTAVGLPWGTGVKKVVLQFGDAPPLDPEPQTGLTQSDVIAAAKAVDPASVYVVDVSPRGEGTATGSLAAIATETGGRVIRSASPGQVEGVLGEIVDEAASKPFAWAGGPYIATVGSPVTLDARGSFDDSRVASYEWDVDGDGGYEQSTAVPELTHVYGGELEGVIGLRVTDDSGLRAEATSAILVSRDGDLVAGGADNCVDVANPGQGDYDGDGFGDECDSTPGFPKSPGPPGDDGSGSGLVVVGVSVLALIASAIAVLVLSSGRHRRRNPGFCDRCGERQLPEDSVFCDRCGAMIRHDERKAVRP